MKKSCLGCRAYMCESNSGSCGHCELGIKTKTVIKTVYFKELKQNIQILVPIEECEKPKTYSELLKIKDRI